MTAFKKFGLEATKRNGMTSLWLGYDYYTVISDPLIAETVLKTCLEKGYLMEVFSHLVGNGSVIAPVNIWRPRRKLLTPNFSSKNLQAFVKVFSKQSEILVERLASVADKRTFSIWKYFTAYSMDSVCETTLGVQVNAQGLPRCEFLCAFEQYCALAAARMCRPWPCALPTRAARTAYSAHRDYIWNYIDNIIKMKTEDMKCEQLSDEMDLQRFLPAASSAPSPQRHAAYMPFSTGPRNCIGYQYGMMSVKTVLATLIRSYRLLPTPRHAHPAHPPHPLRLKYDIMLRDVDNYMVRLQPRTGAGGRSTLDTLD
ncbi:PREDICTED: cytochrome P450 4d2-like [Papilio polytes]|uniref:cytochrome P450 4d2-like n=1 Tax=Papilio polytes TaxID=76194 RepID=UPI00067676CD|nr:PREDICTED: cytochrome P450 4d2-like [Papilio polytes]